MPVWKEKFLSILLFYEILMYFFVFLTFCFCNIFFGEICGRHFLKHNNAKTNSFQPLRVKISIFIWTMWKNSICIDFVHKITFMEPFSVRRACTKSYVTSEPYPRASQSWCQNVAGNLKGVINTLSRRELCASAEFSCEMSRGGPIFSYLSYAFLTHGMIDASVIILHHLVVDVDQSWKSYFSTSQGVWALSHEIKWLN